MTCGPCLPYQPFCLPPGLPQSAGRPAGVAYPAGREADSGYCLPCSRLKWCTFKVCLVMMFSSDESVQRVPTSRGFWYLKKPCYAKFASVRADAVVGYCLSCYCSKYTESLTPADFCGVVFTPAHFQNSPNIQHMRFFKSYNLDDLFFIVRSWRRDAETQYQIQ